MMKNSLGLHYKATGKTILFILLMNLLYKQNTRM
jgi:hypothetical protein